MYTISKKYLSTTLFLGLLASLYFTLTAFAQEETENEVEVRSSVSTDREPIEILNERPAAEREVPIEEAVELRQENRTEIQTISTEERVEVRQELSNQKREALKENQQKRVLNLSANISNRMEAAIVRIEIIIERFNQRIEKLKAAGIDTATAEVKLSESTRLLVEARAKISGIDTTVYNATTSNDPRADWQNVKTIYRETAQLIKNSHQSLREALALLKEAVKARDGNASAAVEASISTEVDQ